MDESYAIFNQEYSVSDKNLEIEINIAANQQTPGFGAQNQYTPNNRINGLQSQELSMSSFENPSDKQYDYDLNNRDSDI